MRIKVVDSIMGSGKTSYFIEKMRDNSDKKYIYITPYLDEIKRVKDEVGGLSDPKFRGSSKLNDLHKLLSEGKSICSTHALFQKANNVTRQALKANGYTLILDEVMDVVQELTDFTKDDLVALTVRDDLAYIEDDYLIWNPEKLDYNGRYNDIKTMCLNKNLICINDRLMFWNFPIDIFNYFEEVYILTYKFEAQIQKYYYDFHKLEYEMYQMEDWDMVDYSDVRDNKRIEELSKLITIYDGKMNLIGDDKYSLSLNWYRKDDKEQVLQSILKRHVSNWFTNINRGVPSPKRMWTTFKDYKSVLKGIGYTNRFVSLNARATNNYKEAQVLAYCSNRFIRPTIIQFFDRRDIALDQDEYALSEMLQWIWRSRIREGKPIEVYIPSSRMRGLLETFLLGKSKNM